MQRNPRGLRKASLRNTWEMSGAPGIPARGVSLRAEARGSPRFGVASRVRMSVLLGWFAISLPASAATLREAIDAAPRDTIALACIPSPSALEQELRSLATRAAMDGLLPPMVLTPLAALRTELGLGDKFDPEGALIIGALNTTALPEIPDRIFLLLPAKNPQELIEGMEGRSASDESLWHVTFHGSPCHAAVRGKYVVIAKSEATAREAAANPDRALGDVLSREDLQSLDRQDVFVWVKLEEALKLVKPQVDLFTSMSLLAQAATGPAGMKQAELTKKQIDVLLQGLSTYILGVRIEDQGVGLRVAVRVRPGSELDQATRREQTREPLLRGLPSDDYLLAAGSRSSAEAMKRSIESDLRPFLAVGEVLPGVDKAKYTEFARSVEEWVGIMRGLRLVVSSAGADASDTEGLVAIGGCVEVENARRWIELFGQALESMKAILAPEGVQADPDLKRIVGAARWRAKTEELGGAEVATLLFDFSNTEWRGGAESPALKGILGADGLSMRIAMADERNVVFALGGGRKWAEKLIRSAKRNESAIEETPGVRRTAALLPVEREGAGYVAVDRVVNTVVRAARLVGENGPPTLQLPPIESPVGFSSSGGDHVTRVDIVVPNDVIVALKDAYLKSRAGRTAGDPESKPNAGTSAP